MNNFWDIIIYQSNYNGGKQNIIVLQAHDGGYTKLNLNCNNVVFTVNKMISKIYPKVASSFLSPFLHTN